MTCKTHNSSLTERGITIGVSGGGLITDLYFYQNGRLVNLAKSSDYAIIPCPFSKAWVTIISQ